MSLLYHAQQLQLELLEGSAPEGTRTAPVELPREGEVAIAEFVVMMARTVAESDEPAWWYSYFLECIESFRGERELALVKRLLDERLEHGSW